MDIINYFSNMMKKNKNLNSNPEKAYKKLIKESEIDNIINNMPQNLTQMEKAYYIYLELGKLITESTEFVFGDWKTKCEQYYQKIDEKFCGICKSISELYVAILADERVGVDAEIVKQFPDQEITHVDVILKIERKKYLVNLILDLMNIKFFRRTKGFAYDLCEEVPHPIWQEQNRDYYERLESVYGEIDYLDRKQLQEMDKKLNYSFFMPAFMDKESRGIYTDDTIEIIKYEMRNKEKFKEYVLKGKEVPEEEQLKYKLDFIFENKDMFAEEVGKKGYLENIRHYNKLFRSFLTQDEYSRVQTYAATVNNDLRNIISILKVKPPKSKNNLYYFYNAKEDKYEEKTTEQMKEIVDELGHNSMRIIGNLDRMVCSEIDELEL